MEPENHPCEKENHLPSTSMTLGSMLICQGVTSFVIFNIQLMVHWWFGAWWFGYLGSPYERDCYLGVALESQTTN